MIKAGQVYCGQFSTYQIAPNFLGKIFKKVGSFAGKVISGGVKLAVGTIVGGGGSGPMGEVKISPKIDLSGVKLPDISNVKLPEIRSDLGTWLKRNGLWVGLGIAGLIIVVLIIIMAF